MPSSSSSKQKRRGRLRNFWRVSKYALVLLLSYLGWSSYMMYKAGFYDNGSKADAAIVLGAAAWHKKPSPVFQARLDHGIKLFKEGRVKYIILTGGKGKGAEHAEAEVGKMYCVEQGIPEKSIYMDIISVTTHENIREAKKIIDRHAIEEVLLVSDPWHLRRASLMAKGEGITHSCSATKTSKYISFGSNFSFFCRELFFIQVYHVFGI